jgi:transposase
MWLLARAPDSLDQEERVYRDALCRLSPDAAQAEALVQAFQAMVRRRQVEQLDPWLEQANTSGARELSRFALGLRQDYAAVRAALEYEWSQGQRWRAR